MTTIGIRSNNPGNIRVSSTAWAGQTGVNEKGLVILSTAEMGIRAIAKVILTYQDKYGLKTVRDIIARWAPPSENDTAAYVGHVCNCLSVAPDRVIDAHDINIMSELVEAIIDHENGCQPYSQADIVAGCNLALQGH